MKKIPHVQVTISPLFIIFQPPEWSAKNESMEPPRHGDMCTGPGDQVGDDDPFQEVDREQCEYLFLPAPQNLPDGDFLSSLLDRKSHKPDQSQTGDEYGDPGEDADVPHENPIPFELAVEWLIQKKGLELFSRVDLFESFLYGRKGLGSLSRSDPHHQKEASVGIEQKHHGLVGLPEWHVVKVFYDTDDPKGDEVPFFVHDVDPPTEGICDRVIRFSE
jgi:hypothetical protein